MTTIKTLLPKCDVKVTKVDLLFNQVGQYDNMNDLILIDRTFRKDFPHHSLLVLMHEIFHSTGIKKRNNRIERLVHHYGAFTKNSTSYAVEEVICELAGMVLARTLGMFGPVDRAVFGQGISFYKRTGVKIPWREVVAAVYYFSEDTKQFDRHLTFIKSYTKYKYGLEFQETYDS